MVRFQEDAREEKSLETIVFHSHTFRKSFEQPLKLFFQTNYTERKKRYTLLDTVFFFLVSLGNVKKIGEAEKCSKSIFLCRDENEVPKGGRDKNHAQVCFIFYISKK